MVSSKADAEDVFQEVWIKVIRKIDTYRPDNFAAWLMTLTRNRIIDRSRVQKNHMSLNEPSESGQLPIDQVESTVLNPLDQSAAHELGERIESAVSGLPADQREVFLMRTQMDLGFKAIAVIQGVSINTALARMQYALDKLRNALQSDYDVLGRVG
jgi:RNA polymerase sigma-70 factor (ECF subfamily)